jgi:hypothetical protein
MISVCGIEYIMADNAGTALCTAHALSRRSYSRRVSTPASGDPTVPACEGRYGLATNAGPQVSVSP